MDVELPDGQVIKGVPDGTTKAQLAQKLQANGINVPKEWLAQAEPKEVARGTFLPFKIMAGDEKQPTDMWKAMAGPRLAMPSVVQSAIQAFTAPGRALQSGQGDFMEGKFDPHEEAQNVALNMIGPEIAKGAKLPSLVARKGEELAKESFRNSAHDTIIQNAQAEGYKIPPTDSMTGRAAIKVAGKTPVKADLLLQNQEVTNKIARREAGLRSVEPITDEYLEAARTRIGEPYRELSNVSPEAGKMWDEVRQARADATKQWKHYNRTHDPAIEEKARAFDSKANKLQDQIDQIATSLESRKDLYDPPLRIQPNLVDRLKEARVQFAKNYQVDRAATPGGDVDAKAIARSAKYQKLTGGLQTIADFEVERRPHFGLEMQLEHDLHVGGGVGLNHIGGGAWATGVPVIRGAARSLATSKMMQPGKPDYNVGMAVKLSDIASQGGKYSFPVVPGLGLKAEEE